MSGTLTAFLKLSTLTIADHTDQGPAKLVQNVRIETNSNEFKWHFRKAK